jgi:hypothetical protein
MKIFHALKKIHQHRVEYKDRHVCILNVGFNMTPPADKSMKKRLRKLAAIAHERELAAALKELHAGFADWQAGKIDSFELSDRIHAFNQETAREIWKMYLPARPSGMQIARALAGLAPFEPERAAFRAGRLMLEEIFIHARRGESFAFETTLSGRGYARLISGWPCRRLPRQALFSPARDTRTGHCPCSSKGP